MARRTLDTVDFRIDSRHTEDILQVMANANKNPYILIIEYVQNAVDDALKARDAAGGKRLLHPLEVTVDIDSRTGEVRILDNGGGMDPDGLKKLAANVFNPRKDDRGEIMRAGIGVHLFRSYFKKATIRTKAKGSKLLELVIRRGEENLKGNKIDELDCGDDDFPHDSGTLVILSEVAPSKGKRYRIDLNELKARLEERFGYLLADSSMKIKILKDGSEYAVCEGPDSIASGSQHVKASI